MTRPQTWLLRLSVAALLAMNAVYAWQSGRWSAMVAHDLAVIAHQETQLGEALTVLEAQDRTLTEARAAVREARALLQTQGQALRRLVATCAGERWTWDAEAGGDEEGGAH